MKIISSFRSLTIHLTLNSENCNKMGNIYCIKKYFRCSEKCCEKHAYSVRISAQILNIIHFNHLQYNTAEIGHKNGFSAIFSQAFV